MQLPFQGSKSAKLRAGFPLQVPRERERSERYGSYKGERANPGLQSTSLGFHFSGRCHCQWDPLSPRGPHPRPWGEWAAAASAPAAPLAGVLLGVANPKTMATLFSGFVLAAGSPLENKTSTRAFHIAEQ